MYRTTYIDTHKEEEKRKARETKEEDGRTTEPRGMENVDKFSLENF